MYETEIINGRKAIVRTKLPKEEIKVGQKWIAACCMDYVVEIVKLDEDGWVYYKNDFEDTIYDKDHFSFQTRYCLIVQ